MVVVVPIGWSMSTRWIWVGIIEWDGKRCFWRRALWRRVSVHGTIDEERDGWNEMRQDACRTESCKCATKLGSLGMGGCHVLAFYRLLCVLFCVNPLYTIDSLSLNTLHEDVCLRPSILTCYDVTSHFWRVGFSWDKYVCTLIVWQYNKYEVN